MVKLISLNIEGHKHIDRVCEFLKSQDADVICLQEVFQVDLTILEKATGMRAYFAPNATVEGPNKADFPPLGPWGVVWMSRLPHEPVEVAYYHGQGTAPVMNFRPNDADRALIWSVVEKNGRRYRIGTTHFTWTPDGQINDDQRRDFEVLSEMIRDFNSLVFCGDFNAPRGREMFSKFEELLIDHLPEDIPSTLDPELHKKKPGLSLVVDTIFSTDHYHVSQVRTISGVSDHLAVTGVVEWAHA